MTEYHKFSNEVSLGIPAGYIFFLSLPSFLLLMFGQDDKIRILKLLHI